MRRHVAHVLLAICLSLTGLAIVSSVAAATAGPAQRGHLDPLVPPLPAEASVSSRNGVIDPGRQSHSFRYRVDTAEEFWSLELFLTDSRGRPVASAYQNVGADPKVGRDVFRFASHAIRPGNFTIRAKLTWGDYDRAEKWLEPRTIHLRKR